MHFRPIIFSSSTHSRLMAASRTEQKFLSLFDIPPDFFDSCRLVSSSSYPSSNIESKVIIDEPDEDGKLLDSIEEIGDEKLKDAVPRWSCNTCKLEFDSLLDQRSHFKSDVHRLNIKLTVAGKKTIKEEDFDELENNISFDNFDVSSISGSEDELEKGSIPATSRTGKGREGVKQKLYLQLESGEMVSVYRSSVMNDSEDLLVDNGKSEHVYDARYVSHVDEAELIGRIKLMTCEPRNQTRLRVVLLVSGGHFAGCVFDGNTVVAHKTFHRYVVRAKAGKKQSANDATGKVAHSAGSSLRRHNEAALKKEIQELLVAWKPYIDSSSSIFVSAGSKNRQMLYDTEKSYLHGRAVCHIPLTVRRPTLKEARRVYNNLTSLTYEVELQLPTITSNDADLNQKPVEEHLSKSLMINKPSSENQVEKENKNETQNETTPLHEAAKLGDTQRILELLEQGSDPCIKDARGRTPYMWASEKEVRNTFRRFMALNLDKWDWNAANVPSALTKEMEEAQAAKQAEKDAKRKAKAKELKKLKKAKEKAKAEAGQVQTAASAVSESEGTSSQSRGAIPPSTAKQQTHIRGRPIIISKEEEQKRALAEEREKRAAAAERRIAALKASQSSTTTVDATSNSQSKGCAGDVFCSCCASSLAGKIPFHRYNYKYCSTTCMHVHREMLEDG